MKEPKSIQGYLTEAEGECLRLYAKDKVCLEIGSYLGRSSCYIASTAKKLICVDPFDSSWNGTKWEKNNKTISDFIFNTNDHKNIIPIITLFDNCDFIKDSYFDLIFIDGAHDYDSVMSDIYYAGEKIKKSGIIFFHDYCEKYPGVIKSVNEVFSKPHTIVDSLAMILVDTL